MLAQAWGPVSGSQNPYKAGHGGMHLQSQNSYGEVGGREQEDHPENHGPASLGCTVQLSKVEGKNQILKVAL